MEEERLKLAATRSTSSSSSSTSSPFSWRHYYQYRLSQQQQRLVNLGHRLKQRVAEEKKSRETKSAIKLLDAATANRQLLNRKGGRRGREALKQKTHISNGNNPVALQSRPSSTGHSQPHRLTALRKQSIAITRKFWSQRPAAG